MVPGSLDELVDRVTLTAALKGSRSPPEISGWLPFWRSRRRRPECSQHRALHESSVKEKGLDVDLFPLSTEISTLCYEYMIFMNL